MTRGRGQASFRAELGRRIAAGAAFLCFVSGCRDESSPAPAENSRPPQWFTEITTDVGLDFIHETGATGELHLPEIMGGGCAMFDFDHDGDLDIYLITANDTLPEAGIADHPVNRLYRQEADGRFTDVTAESGLGDGGYGMGVAIGDIDNDGHPDVYVTNYGPDRLYRNRGDGTFEDVTEAAGIDVDGWSCSAAFFDYDRDGFLDLYVTRYVDFDPRKRCSDAAGRPDYCSPKVFGPVADVLLHNNGDPGTPGFTDVSEQAGIASAAAAGLGVVCEDFNQDGWPDVYVANDLYANHLWINQGDGTFRDMAVIMGAAYNLHGQPEAGMGVVAADFHGHGQLVWFMTHLPTEINTLYRNLGGDVGFEDVTGSAGLGASSMEYTGFGTAAF
ncbi:MAG: VCBS repeat-containing protein, partial [Planctomycetes bacterium]|nr:VCBS repeat-containing protein [Planctomycetota bacterium]